MIAYEYSGIHIFRASPYFDQSWPDICEVGGKASLTQKVRTKMAQILPAIIMFFITVIFAALFFVPATKFPQKNKLINFYWSGFWIYLALIAAFAGASNILLILQYDAMSFSNAALMGISASFVLFVMFAWARLSSSAFIALFKRLRKNHNAA